MQISPLNNRQAFQNQPLDGKSLIPYDKNENSYQPDDFDYSYEPLDPLGEAIRNIELRHTYNSKRNVTPPKKHRNQSKQPEKPKDRSQNQIADLNAETFEAINYNLNKLEDRENPVECLTENESQKDINQKHNNVKPKKGDQRTEGLLMDDGKIPHPSKVFDMFVIQQKQQQRR